MLGRIPARGQRQRGGEGSTGDTEEEAEDQHLSVGMNADLPGVGHGGDHDDLTDDRRLLRRQAINQNAHDDAQQRAGQHRRGDHHALFGVRQAEILGDADAKWPKQHPDHEGQIEVEKGREQRGRVAGLKE